MANAPLQNGPSTPTKFETLLTQLMTGITSVLPAKSTLQVAAATMTPAQLLSALQVFVTVLTAVRSAKSAYVTALQSSKAQAVAARKLYADIKAALEGALGKSNPQLGNFGFTPRKAPTPLTAAQKVARAARGQVTRQLRHTAGPKAKLKIKAGSPTVQIDPGGATTVTPNLADAPVTSADGGTGSNAAGSSAAPAAGGPTAK